MNAQYVRVDYIDLGNEIGLSTDDNRNRKVGCNHAPIISCTYVYLACKGVYECWCRDFRVRGFRGVFGTCS